MGKCARNFSRNLDRLLDCGGQINIADKITDLILKKEFSSSCSTKAVYEVLVNEWAYNVMSINLPGTVDSESFYSEISKWKAADIVLLYHHPDLGAIVINPKNPNHKEYIADLRKNELVVVYVGYAGKKDGDTLCENIAKKCLDLLSGKKVKAPSTFLTGSYGFKKIKAETKPKATKTATKTTAKSKTTGKAATTGSFSFGEGSKSDVVSKPTGQNVSPSSLRKMSPMVSVPVTNELFHNGNVEAWKRIIASYTNKYPKLQIFVYYEGERITDINALFKWGKVKHGSCIQFVVAGDDIQDVAKLKRYFTQGASPMFEAFLQGAPGSILPLF